jgi:hypothetical protein
MSPPRSPSASRRAPATDVSRISVSARAPVRDLDDGSMPEEASPGRPTVDHTRGSSNLPRQAYDRIACRGCGRWFTTTDGPGMLAAIKGSCPECEGAFELVAEDRRLPDRAGSDTPLR